MAKGLICIKAADAYLPHTAAMNLRSLLLLAATGGVFISTTALAAADRVFEVSGVVRSSLADGKIVVAHQEIPGYMPAMTMAFAVADPKEAVPLKSGDRVRFQFRVTDTSSSAVNFTVVGRDEMVVQSSMPTVSRGRLRAGDAVPEFSLLDQNNHSFTAAELRGHLTIVTFVFTRCPVPEYCPAMALRFAQLQKTILSDPQLAAHARLLSISIDPEFDRPEILQAYGEAVGANPSIWQFATGGSEQVKALARSFAVFSERNGATLDHTLCTALIDRAGRVVDLWRGNGWKTEEIIAALAKAAAQHECCAVTCRAASTTE